MKMQTYSFSTHLDSAAVPHPNEGPAARRKMSAPLQRRGNGAHLKLDMRWCSHGAIFPLLCRPHREQPLTSTAVAHSHPPRRGLRHNPCATTLAVFLPDAMVHTMLWCTPGADVSAAAPSLVCQLDSTFHSATAQSSLLLPLCVGYISGVQWQMCMYMCRLYICAYMHTRANRVGLT